ncbi:MAG: hypothetical protein MJZ17_11285 [Bacteroidales bacterium]|nr:hypothetical protein [Bacteroidales bacterium]
MTPYADAAYYTGTYLSGRDAVIPSAQFPFYARDATMRIHQRTYGRVSETVPEEVKLCCCEIAEALYQAEQANKKTEGGTVASESNGGWSKTYVTADGKASAETLNAAAENIMQKWLGNTGYLYLGVE